MDDSLCEMFRGQFVEANSFDTLISDDADVLKPDGSVLLKYRLGVVPLNTVDEVRPFFRKAATPTNNRGIAAGIIRNNESMTRTVAKQSLTRYTPKTKAGYISNTNYGKEVNSGVIGYMDGVNPRFPYCRLTAFNLNHPTMFRSVLPFIHAVDGHFKATMPERYSAQQSVVEQTHADFHISGTSFTTVTVNKNFRTAVHKDEGDLRAGFGVMSVLRRGTYEGCFLCFPKYRVAVDMKSGAVLLADVHEWHGNTPLVGTDGNYERISLVFYYREKMRECGSATEELERIKMARGAIKR